MITIYQYLEATAAAATAAAAAAATTAKGSFPLELAAHSGRPDYMHKYISTGEGRNAGNLAQTRGERKGRNYTFGR